VGEITNESDWSELGFIPDSRYGIYSQIPRHTCYNRYQLIMLKFEFFGSGGLCGLRTCSAQIGNV